MEEASSIFAKAYKDSESRTAKELFSNDSIDLLFDIMLQVRPIIYAVLYNPMVHESTWGLISLHKHLKGAEMALAFHKHTIEQEDGVEYCDNMDWRIQKYDLFE